MIVLIRNVRMEDAEEISYIYNYYIENTIITFEEEVVSVGEIKKRIKEITKLFPWFVYEEKGKIHGYAYANKWRGRSAYRYSVESSVYLNKNSVSKGIGTKLYSKLLNELKDNGFHAVIAVISLPNDKSQKLHENLGFKKIGYFSETGYKFQRWIDVAYWELLFN
ncbi:MAG: N-acetyltransferase family protein [Bacillota bacterium]